MVPWMKSREGFRYISLSSASEASIGLKCKKRLTAFTKSPTIRVSRCPVFNRTVRYFGSLSDIKYRTMYVSIAQYFVPTALELPVSGILREPSDNPTNNGLLQMKKKEM